MPRWAPVAILGLLNAALLVWGLVAHPTATDVGGKRLKVGMVLDLGGLGDKSFNDAAYNGLMRAAGELDITTRFIEPGDGSDRESAIRQLAAGGFDLVIGVGIIATDDMRSAAQRFPNVKFACVDFSVAPGDPPVPPNLVGLRFREHEGSFLVGALAAMVSKTKILGFVGGMDIPLIHKFQVGFEAGARHVCPECKVLVGYAGTDLKAFADPTTGKELALTQLDQGADIIFHASGRTGTGVFNAVEERGKFAIGVDADQFHEAPCCILTSMVKGVDVSVDEVIHEAAAGTWKGGVKELGLAEGGVNYIYDDHNRQWISEEVHQRVEELRQEIIAKKIVVPWK